MRGRPTNTNPSSAPRAGLARRFSVAGLSAVLLVSCWELSARALGIEYPPLEIPVLFAARGASLDVASQSGLYLPDARQLWRPRPGARVGALSPNPDELVNAAGFRGPELTPAKKEGVLRIATLGDSSTFGVLVPFGDCYTARLEEHVRQSGVACETLCGGVIGYTARQGLERYLADVRPYRPDVVVAAFGAVNEAGDAKGVSDAALVQRNLARDTRAARLRSWLRAHSRVVQGLAYASDALRGGRTAVIEQLKADMIAEHLPDPESVASAWPGVRRSSPEEVVHDLLALESAVRADGGTLVVVSMPRSRELERLMPVLVDYSRAIEAACREHALPFLDARALFLEARTPDLEAELFIHPRDGVHPSPAGHDLLAEALAERIAAATRP